MQMSAANFESYSNRVSELLRKIKQEDLKNLLTAMKNTIANHGTIYVIGNGGSASTASHFCNDLRIIAQRREVMIKVFSLTDNSSSVTAIGNDMKFEDIFKAQLNGILNNIDLVFCISASGNSNNLISAVKYANEVGAQTVSLVGFDGGTLSKISRYYCLVPSVNGEYEPTEDIHLSICHYLAINM
jgi:D-sedoheptulose 7-phosphate isomerase